MNRFREAVESRDLDAIMETLAPDVVVHSPISRRVSFRGHAEARRLFEVVLELLGDLCYTDEVTQGDVTMAAVELQLGGHDLHEIQLVRFDERGRVRELTLFMRPLPGVTGLTAALGPRLARRRGRAASLAVAAFMRPLAAVVRAGDRAGSRMV